MHKDPSKERALRMLAPLLRMARDAPNEPEGQTAMKKARLLMQKYNIAESDVTRDERPRNKRDEKPRRSGVPRRRPSTWDGKKEEPAREPDLGWPDAKEDVYAVARRAPKAKAEDMRRVQSGTTLWHAMRSLNDVTAWQAIENDPFNPNRIAYGENDNGGLAMYRMSGDETVPATRTVCRSVDELADFLRANVHQADVAWWTNNHEIIASPNEQLSVALIHPDDARRYLMLARDQVFPGRSRYHP